MQFFYFIFGQVFNVGDAVVCLMVIYGVEEEEVVRIIVIGVLQWDELEEVIRVLSGYEIVYFIGQGGFWSELFIVESELEFQFYNEFFEWEYVEEEDEYEEEEVEEVYDFELIGGGDDWVQQVDPGGGGIVLE